MQNQYAGDVGDFGKLGLLRALIGLYPPAVPPLKLGVVWYLTPDSGNDDGRHRAYLKADRPRNRTRFRECDPKLYDALQSLSAGSVYAIEQSGVLRPHTVYHGGPVGTGEARQAWAAAAYGSAKSCDVVFVDPDNGIAPISVTLRSNRSPKFVFVGDVSLSPEQSLVIYHHLGRTGTASDQAARQVERLREAFPLHAAPWAVRFRRGTVRLFLVVPALKHLAELSGRRDVLLGGPWGHHGHFSECGLA